MGKKKKRDKKEKKKQTQCPFHKIVHLHDNWEGVKYEKMELHKLWITRMFNGGTLGKVGGGENR